MVKVERFPPGVPDRMPGRALKHHTPIARAFLAKMVLNAVPTTALVARMRSETALRRLCSWHRVCDVPSESTSSRAFKELAELTARQHAA